MNSSLEILLVEDNPNDAELTIRALEKRNLGNHIVHVEDGQAALDFLFCTGPHASRDQNDLPKVVLLDMKLPKVNGIEVLQQIRANHCTKLLPVVMLTSSREEQDLMAAYNLGVNSYIVKPVEFENFSEAVSSMGLYWVLLNEPPFQKS